MNQKQNFNSTVLERFGIPMQGILASVKKLLSLYEIYRIENAEGQTLKLIYILYTHCIATLYELYSLSNSRRKKVERHYLDNVW
jgi:hypothetical protein